MFILIVVEDTPGGLDGFLKISVLMLVILVVLSFVGCVAYSVSMGGKYCVVFTLDEKGVIHQQHDSQAKKAELLSDLAIFAGALAANPTAVGIGINSRRTMMETKFKNVHWIKVERGYDTIHVDTNEVYVLQDDFDFVLYYIIEHCPKAEVKEK